MTPVQRARLREENDALSIRVGGTPAERAEYHALCAEQTDVARNRRAHTRAAGIAAREAGGSERVVAARAARRAAAAARAEADGLEADSTMDPADVAMVVLMGREAAAEAEAAANTADADALTLKEVTACTKR